MVVSARNERTKVMNLISRVAERTARVFPTIILVNQTAKAASKRWNMEGDGGRVKMLGLGRNSLYF
jgi:hypothetical protein